MKKFIRPIFYKKNTYDIMTFRKHGKATYEPNYNVPRYITKQCIRLYLFTVANFSNILAIIAIIVSIALPLLLK